LFECKPAALIGMAAVAAPNVQPIEHAIGLASTEALLVECCQANPFL
jgi:hypothetical protein